MRLLDDVHDINVQAFKDQCELVHERDIEIPLDVSMTFAASAVLISLTVTTFLRVADVELRRCVSPFRRDAPHDSDHVLDGMIGVSRVIALRTVRRVQNRSRLSSPTPRANGFSTFIDHSG